jgi:hypothetical protein
MLTWLESQAHNSPRKTSADVFGIQLVDESPYLIKLLESLLTKQAWLDEPQKTFQSRCTQVICAAQEIFGEKVGVQLLFMLGRFGFNGSHLKVRNADLWKSEELDTALLTLSDLPKQLISPNPLAYNHPLNHFKRGNDPTQPDPGQPAANAIIFVFNDWSLESAANQRYILFHELGHNADDGLVFSDSPSWFHAAGWKDSDLSWDLIHPERAVSKYAETNPLEDFAESFAAYRYNSSTLKKASPDVYQFMKKNVFHGIEYTSESSCKSTRTATPPETIQ